MDQSAFRDMISGVVFLILGIVGTYLAMEYPIGIMRRIGPGAFPLFVCGLLAFVGALLVLKSMPTVLREPRDKIAPRIGRLALAAGLILGALLAFAFLIERLGLALTSFICVFISYSGSVRILRSSGGPVEGVIVSASVAAFVVLVFVVGVGMPIRVWP